jgi:glycosyltransferase involved in cell wall biosynthesis
MYVTGNFINNRDLVDKYSSPTLKFLGFVEDDYYWKLLGSSDVVIDLTNRNNCLVCGAYEAVAVETPIILSNTDVLRDYFSKGTVFTKNQSENIVASIIYLLNNIEQFRKDISDLKRNIQKDWDDLGLKLKAIIKK